MQFFDDAVPIPKSGTHINKYILADFIDKTNNSCVFSAYNEMNGQKVAIKLIHVKDSNKERVQNEVNLLKEIDCPYIISGLDYFDIPHFSCVVMPLCEECLQKENPLRSSSSMPSISNSFNKGSAMTEDSARKILYDALHALKYLHNRNIIHRDIKLGNFLMIGNDAYLADFGLATKHEKNELLTEPVGTLQFAAPEIINHEPYDDSIDIWSLGVTLFSLLSGNHPFPLSPECTLRRCITKAAFFYPAAQWRNISKNAKDLIDKMIVADPKKRITIEDALKHPWMVSLPEKMPRKNSIGTEINHAFDLLTEYESCL
ncbi:Myosin light chain kinase A [Tritrichomonas foetus]|uniref:Myosin light chain kinase A n=1 Tax=Tritrichomonas foetus TaxID=1144522 RepID=A0A1J4KWT5_9EUKA|nr:Myosin light chain kinase A [Tritrichomonas foetus]|eukprot:OHT15753.1 Myosin light chain kinase A [Tritrichomonas foetus]